MSSCWLQALTEMATLPTGVRVLNPSGGTDDAPALNALTASGDRRILLGAGTFNIRSTVQVLQNNTTLEGVGTGATIIRIDDTLGNIGDGILIKNCKNARVQDLTITATAGRTAGNGIHVVGGDPTDPLTSSAPELVNSGVFIDRVDMASQFNGILVENDAVNDYRCWRLYVRGGRHSAVSASGCGIWLNTCSAANKVGASHFIENWWLGQTPTTTTAGIRLTGSGDVTLTNNETFGTTYGLLIDPGASGFLTSVTVNGGFYDRAGTACLRIAPNATVGKFGEIKFNGTWFAGSTSGNVADIVGASAKLIQFNNCSFYSAEGTPGWCAKVDASTNVQFLGGSVAGATTGGLLFTNNASDFTVQGVTFTTAGIGTGSTTLPIGVQIDAGSDHYSVTGNIVRAPATTITNTPGTSAGRRIVQDNVVS